MKGRNVQRLLERCILPFLPNYKVHGSLVYALPVDCLLRAFKFESSAFKDSEFNVQYFAMPLYVPTEYLYFTFGARVGQGVSWDVDRGDVAQIMANVREYLERVGLPFLQGVRTPGDLPS